MGPISVYISFKPQRAGYIPGRLFTYQSSRLLTAECRTSANVNTHLAARRPRSTPDIYTRVQFSLVSFYLGAPYLIVV